MFERWPFRGRRVAENEEPGQKEGFFQQLKRGLSRMRQGFLGSLEKVLKGRTAIDQALLDDLEELLIMADLGIATTSKIIEKLREEVKTKQLKSAEELKGALQDVLFELLTRVDPPLELHNGMTKPYVIMVVGVNGVGKTTTIGKLASRYRSMGKRVLLAAGDTFRAAAVEQLEIWGERAEAELVKHRSGASPSAVIFDAIQASKARGCDILIADTAGRLHTKTNLMEELKKVRKIIEREVPGAPHEVLLVLDATTGQNAIAQAKSFHQAIGVTGLVLAKLDSTAKGGVVITILDELGIPVKYIGIGEKINDLSLFSPEEFVEALFSPEGGA